MLGFDWQLVVCGWVIATVLLLIGMALGIWMGGGTTSHLLDGHREMHQARLIASRLQHLTKDVSTIVDEHRAQIDQAIQQLANTRHRDHESLAKLVVDVFGNIVSANKSLELSLSSAESRLQEQAEEIEAHMSLSMTDPLTGLLNRRGFDDQLNTQLAARRKSGEAFSVLILDLDHFKQVNDHYGHAVGDRLLVAVANALRESLRQEDFIARFGGDEFAILLPHTTLEEGVVVGQKLNTQVAATSIEERGVKLTITASSGLAMNAAAEDGKSLLERADAALYAAKEAGRNIAYMHNGVECCPTPVSIPSAMLNDSDCTQPATDAVCRSEQVSLAETRGSLDGESLTPVTSGPSAGIGSAEPLEDEISPDLDDLCVELRRYLADRQQLGQTPAMPDQAL
jgi:diguanylate cyclase